MKKLVLLSVLAAAISACSVQQVSSPGQEKAVSLSMPADFVKLYYAKASWYNQGNDSYGKVKGFIEIADVSYVKQVMVRYIVSGTAVWVDVPAYYVKDHYNKEVWQFDLSGIAFDAAGVFDIQFCLYYTVNGQTYWDNNQGQNYRLLMQPGQGAYSDIVFGKSLVAFNYAECYIYRDHAYDSVFFGTVYIQDQSAPAVVDVVYSTDSWITTLSATAVYQYSGDTGEKVYRFFTQVPASTSRIDFAFSYQVNGYTAWDNNFLADYRIEVPAPEIQGTLW